MSSFKDIINKQIRTVTYDEYQINFHTIEDDKAVVYTAFGDCCSQSYIESLDCPEVFNDAKLLDVEVVSGDAKDIDDYSVYKWTFYKFKTTKGMCTLSFRNESNGYYNGYLERAKWKD